MGLVDWLRTVWLATIWGCSFFLIEIALNGAGPFTIALTRVAFAAIGLGVYCVAIGRPVAGTKHLILPFLILGLVHNALPFSLIALGQTWITSSVTAILIATTPLFTVIVAHQWARAETATPLKVIGVLVGFAGVAVLVGKDALEGLGDNLWGQMLVLAGALAYAVGAVYARRFRHLPAEQISFGMLAAATLLMLPLAFTLESPLSPLPDWRVLAALAALGLICTGLAYILYFRTLASAGATNVMLVTFIQPAVAIFLGVIFLGEPLGANHIAGFTLILAGLALVDGRMLRLTTKILSP
ncbi:MAG: DMT family transporter [Hyphomicrobiales bacterium]|nr:DMT family transporter [Hyphomicrobiales bacterium]